MRDTRLILLSPGRAAVPLLCICVLQLHLGLEPAAATALPASGAILFPAPEQHRPALAEAVVEQEGRRLVLRNSVLEAVWTVDQDGVLKPQHIQNKLTQTTLAWEGNTKAFALRVGAANQYVDSSAFVQRDTQGVGFTLLRLPGNASSPQPGQAEGGWKAVVGGLHAPAAVGDFTVEWWVELRDHSNYVRMGVDITASPSATTVLQDLVLYDGHIPHAMKAGNVDGVPVVTESFFLGFEHPQALNWVADNAYVIRVTNNIAPLFQNGVCDWRCVWKVLCAKYVSNPE